MTGKTSRTTLSLRRLTLLEAALGFLQEAFLAALLAQLPALFR